MRTIINRTEDDEHENGHTNGDNCLCFLSPPNSIWCSFFQTNTAH